MYGVVNLIYHDNVWWGLFMVYGSKNPRAGPDLLTHIIKMCQTPKCESMSSTLLNVNNTIRIHNSCPLIHKSVCNKAMEKEHTQEIKIRVRCEMKKG